MPGHVVYLFSCSSSSLSSDLLLLNFRPLKQPHPNMAFFFNKTAIASHFRSRSQMSEDLVSLSRRQYHTTPGPREKALLADDPALKPFKSYKQSVKQLKRIGDVLTIVVVAGCCYEIYVRATTREEARKQ